MPNSTGKIDINITSIFTLQSYQSTRGHGYKFCLPGCRTDARKFFFTQHTQNRFVVSGGRCELGTKHVAKVRCGRPEAQRRPLKRGTLSGTRLAIYHPADYVCSGGCRDFLSVGGRRLLFRQCQTNYLNICRTDLYEICRIGRTLAVDERSEVIFFRSLCGQNRPPILILKFA